MGHDGRWLWIAGLLLWCCGGLAGCANHEKRMATRVDWYLEANRHYDALDYLEGYLDHYPTSERAWRYRVNIRLAMDQRPQAAAEYWRLRTALGVHHLDALERVVHAGGAGWTLPEYFALSRCGAGGVGDLAFFEQTLLGHPVSQDASIVLAPPTETVLGVMRALPGRFGVDALPLIEEGLRHPSDEVRLDAGRALLRLDSAVGDDPGETSGETDTLLEGAFADSSPRVRRGMIEAVMLTGDPERWARVPLGEDENDAGVAVAWFGIVAPDDAQRASAVRARAATVAPVAAALTGLGEHAPPAKGDPRLGLAIRMGNGSCDERCWTRATVDLRRDLSTLAAPFVPLESGMLALMAADPDPVVRTSAARYLVHSSDRAALMPLLSDPEQGVRAAAAAALVAAGDDGGREALLVYLDQAGLEEKLSLVDALLRHQPHPFGEVALRLAGDETPLVRENALPAVATACADEHEAVFLLGLTDDDPHVVVRAAAALYLVATRMAANTPPPAPVNPPSGSE